MDRRSRQFTKAQMRNFFHTMKALTSYHESATLIVIENRNNGSNIANFVRVIMVSIFSDDSNVVRFNTRLTSHIL